MSHDHDPPAPIDHVAAFSVAVDRFVAAVEAGPLDAPVVGCPGWDLRALASHLGGVHRWADHAIHHHEPLTERDAAPEGDTATIVAWLREGASRLVTSLAELDPEGPTWHPFPVAKLGRVWPRRQHHEAYLHAWDAETAVGAATPLEPAVASDAIDEYFEVMLPRLVSREHLTLPASTLHVHCTDTEGEWLVWAECATVGLRREHAKGDAALRGSAEALLLRLWGRPVPDDAVEIVGSTEAAAAWLALGGA